MKRGDLVELEISSPAFEGSAVGRIENLVVFVPYAVPGDRITAKIKRKRKKYAEAVIEKLLVPSPDRIEARCVHFGVCGGCTLQNADYQKQLEYKRTIVQELMERVGGLKQIMVEPVIPSPVQYEYRNKMEFSFGASRWLTSEEIASGEKLSRNFALGLHIPKRFDKILDLQECYLQHPSSTAILDICRKIALERHWTPYDVGSHSGYLRNLIIRRGINTGELMVNLVTTAYDPAKAELLMERVLEVEPTVTTFLNSINSGPNPTTIEEEHILLGDGMLRDRIGPITYRISPSSFFQPNTLQAENLLSTIKAAASPTPDDVVFDLYSGLGSISLFLAGTAGAVVGVESHARSVELAATNAPANGISNCRFYAGDVLEALQDDFFREYGRPDIVILDPPRVGLHPKAPSRILEAAPKKIIYTSCNPATQARDLSLLEEGYDIDSIQPVDMFPQTWHIESVATLRRRKV